jgi:hypothetical protein
MTLQLRIVRSKDQMGGALFTVREVYANGYDEVVAIGAVPYNATDEELRAAALQPIVDADLFKRPLMGLA